MSHFYVSTLISDDVVVAGTRFAKVWVNVFTPPWEQKKLESSKEPGTMKCFRADGRLFRDGVVVLGPVIKVRNDMWNIGKIGIIKLKGN